MKLISYAKLLKKCNTMENEIETLQAQHDDDIRVKLALANDVRKLKAQIKEYKEKNKKATKKTKTAVKKSKTKKGD